MNDKRKLGRREMLKRGLAAGVALGLPGGLGTVGCAGRRRGERPNVVLITLDTTRVDRLGCYGYERPTSPRIDRLAAESLIYEDAIAPSSWTLPSHASLFTGRFTTSHGARYDPAGPLRLMDAIEGPDGWDHYRARGLSPRQATLAELLRNAGYATGSVVAGPWMKRVFGLDRGFETYDDQDIGNVNGRRANSVTESASRWVREMRDREFFLFLNYYDPHGPLTPPRELVTKFLPSVQNLEPGQALTREQERAFYDAEILYMDTWVGQLLDTLKAEDLYDNSWIIVTSDHGELFGEHGKSGHGHYLYQEEIHVPFFVKYPAGEQAPGRTDQRVQLTDVLPMVCRRLGLPVPEGVQGRVPGEGSRLAIAETYPLPSAHYDGDWRAIFEGDIKLLWNSTGPHQVYDIRSDPREQVDLAGQDAERDRLMLERLQTYLASLPAPGEAGPEQELDEDTREALRNLGYVN